MSAGPTFVVHIDADGVADYLAFGAADGRFLVIDERAPGDRVYAITRGHPRAMLADLIGGDPVSHLEDGRTPALMAVLDAARDGRRHLAAVPREGEHA